MSDQTFHTPSFGDEEFDIPVDLNLNPPTYQMHSNMGSLMSDQQTAAFDQHQWHPQTTANPLMTTQTYLQPSTDHSGYQQMIMMQQSAQVHPAVQQPTSGIVSVPHPPQMSSAGGSNYAGQSSPQTAPINSNENGSTSDESDDNAPNDPNTVFQHPSPDSFENEGTKGAAKKTGKATKAKVAKKNKRDPNEPQKPVSAYALFFRDTQAAIKGQNPNASFGDVSKIVASMWEVLSTEHKNVYKKRQETAKKDYLKALAAYRAGTLQTAESIQEVQSPAMTASIVNSPVSAPQQQPLQQNFQFVAQVQNATQNTQQQQQQQANQQTIAAQQQQVQQFGNQQPVQQNFQQQSQIINNNPLPPVNQQASAAQNCIRNGCTNQAIVSVDWEDEYCSNECCLSHCKDVFSNWVNQNNQQTFPVVS